MDEPLTRYSQTQHLDTSELLAHISDDAKALVKMEIALAKAEAKMDINAELDLAKGAAVSAVCAIIGVNMLILAALFALAPDKLWQSTLIVAIILLSAAAIAAYIGWARAEKNPFGNTRATLLEDVEWAKQMVK